MSSVITISQPPSVPGDKSHEAPTEMTFAPMDPDVEPEDLEVIVDIHALKTDSDSAPASESEGSDIDVGEQAKVQARNNSLAKLQGGSNHEGGGRRARKCSNEHDAEKLSTRKVSPAQATVKRRPKNGPDAVIVLKEERVCCVCPCSHPC